MDEQLINTNSQIELLIQRNKELESRNETQSITIRDLMNKNEDKDEEIESLITKEKIDQETKNGLAISLATAKNKLQQAKEDINRVLRYLNGTEIFVTEVFTKTLEEINKE